MRGRSQPCADTASNFNEGDEVFIEDVLDVPSEDRESEPLLDEMLDPYGDRNHFLDGDNH